MSGPPEGAIAALLYHETTEFSNTGVFPTQDEPEKAGVGTGRTAGECESRCNMLNVSRWRRWRSLRPPAAASALAAPTTRRSMASSMARLGRGGRFNQQRACSSASWICLYADRVCSSRSIRRLLFRPDAGALAITGRRLPVRRPYSDSRSPPLPAALSNPGVLGVHLRSENASSVLLVRLFFVSEPATGVRSLTGRFDRPPGLRAAEASTWLSSPAPPGAFSCGAHPCSTETAVNQSGKRGPFGPAAVVKTSRSPIPGAGYPDRRCGRCSPVYCRRSSRRGRREVPAPARSTPAAVSAGRATPETIRDR